MGLSVMYPAGRRHGSGGQMGLSVQYPASPYIDDGMVHPISDRTEHGREADRTERPVARRPQAWQVEQMGLSVL